MEFEDDLTPEGNEATEQCPICGRLNNPGATDSCEHFFGSEWDGEIIWSEKYSRFKDEYDRFVEIRYELKEVFRDFGPPFIERIIREEKIPKDLTRIRSWWEDSPTKVLEDVIHFQFGPVVETDGMLSGAGRSLYHENTELINTVSESLKKLNQKLIERISRQKENDS